MGDFAMIRDFGKRIGVKVVGKKEDEAKRMVMEGILAKATEAKETKDLTWVKENKDLIDWYNAQTEVEPPKKEEKKEETAPLATTTGDNGKTSKKKEVSPLQNAKEKAKAAKEKVKEQKAAVKPKGKGGPRKKADGGPSNKFMVYTAWKKSKEKRTADELSTEFSAVTLGTIRGWLGAWKKGNNLPAGVA